MEVTRRQVLAHRLYGQHLIARGDDPLHVLDGWTVQDSPPGAAAAATHARTAHLDPDWLDGALQEERSVVALYNARTATAIVPARSVAEFGTALLPDDDAGLKAIVGPALPGRTADFAEPVALAVQAIADSLDGTRRSRDDLHEDLRGRLPAELLPWCEGCQSHHVRRGLLVMASLRGRLCLAGRDGRQPVFARTDQWTGWKAPSPATAGRALVSAYLRAYGPSTPVHFSQWAGLGIAHARRLWDACADHMVAVEIAGGGTAWTDEDGALLLQDPSSPRGIRVLAPGDPVLLGRDRKLLVVDPAIRKVLWPAINPPGLILSGVEPVAVWRARKQGRRLDVTIETFGRLSRSFVEGELDSFAPLRGCTATSFTWT